MAERSSTQATDLQYKRERHAHPSSILKLLDKPADVQSVPDQKVVVLLPIVHLELS